MNDDARSIFIEGAEHVYGGGEDLDATVLWERFESTLAERKVAAGGCTRRELRPGRRYSAGSCRKRVPSGTGSRNGSLSGLRRPTLHPLSYRRTPTVA